MAAIPRVVIAWDVDGTLRNIERESSDRLVYTPYSDMIFLLVTLAKMKNVRIVVWSARGEEYCRKIVQKFNIRKYVWRCADKTPEAADKYNVDISFDDQHKFDLAFHNIIVRNKK
jgi:hypothetical protein